MEGGMVLSEKKIVRKIYFPSKEWGPFLIPPLRSIIQFSHIPASKKLKLEE